MEINNQLIENAGKQEIADELSELEDTFTEVVNSRFIGYDCLAPQDSIAVDVIDMSLTDPNVDRLVSRIDKLVDTIESQQTNTGPYERLDERLFWHKFIGAAVIAGLLFLFSWVFIHMPGTSDVQLAVNNGVTAGIGPINANIAEMKSEMAQMSQNLAVLSATVDLQNPNVSKNLGKIMKQTLQQNGNSKLGLQTFVALATQAQEKGIKTDPQQMTDVGNVLFSINDRTDDFWKASTALLNYRSFDAASEQVSGLLASSLPDCTNSSPSPFKVLEVGPVGDIKKISNAYYENCRFTLDSAKDDQRINTFMKSEFPIIEFRHCLITYSGGDFTLISWTHLENAPLHTLTGNGKGAKINYNGPSMIFIDCLLQFSVSSSTPERGHKIMQTLLAQNGPSLRIPAEN